MAINENTLRIISFVSVGLVILFQFTHAILLSGFDDKFR